MTTPVVVPTGAAVLRPFVEAGVFDAGEVQLCAAFARLKPGVSDEVLVALAVAARGPRRGHVCIDLADVSLLIVDGNDERTIGLPWPGVERWARALAESDLVAVPSGSLDEPIRPLVWDGHRLYLQRYFHDELTVAADLIERARPGPMDTPAVDGAALEATLDTLFGTDDPSGPDLQRRAARNALTRRFTVISGGPGTGKTRTIARLLAAARMLALGRGEVLDVALAAPTGKAASRMTDAVHLAVAEADDEGLIDPAVSAVLSETTATTLHRLLGAVPGSGFRRNRRNPLPHDLVIVDETSMVSLPLMARLLDALRPEAGLVLVGDPFQLASIEAGSVMSDIVGPGALPATGPDSAHAPLAGHVTELTTSHRFGSDSGIARLATAVRRGEVDVAMEILEHGTDGTRWIRDTDRVGVDEVLDELVTAAVEVVAAAEAGDAVAGLASMRRVKVLAATRHGQLGLYDWTRRIEDGIEQAFPSLRTGNRWYVGRPIIVTANDHPNRLSNGDVGLMIHRGDAASVVIPTAPEPRFLPAAQLDRIETWWAMTIHKSQGSEFPHAVVSLPSEASPILTRELLYTAVTRAQDLVTVVASESSIRAAIARPVSRASGLQERLWSIP